MTMTEARDIEATLLSMADGRLARQLMKFFQTGPGQYGEGDRFIGLRNPQVRLVVRQAWRDTPVPEAVKLVKSPLHEVRLCGLLILVEQYLKAMKMRDAWKMNEIFRTYTSLFRHVNNWDLVDLSAIKIVGNHEVLNPDVTLMDRWINPGGHTLWQQRIAMVSTWMTMRHGRGDLCFRHAEVLLSSPHDLLHKAAGWMLREAWKRGYAAEVEEFLERNVARMPGVMLSYTCEKMSPTQRLEWRHKRKVRE